MLDKIVAYELGSGEWTSRTLLFADNGDRAGNFMSDSIDVGRGLPGGVDLTTVYLDRFGSDVEGARAAVRSALENGVAMANYIGHGGPDRFASEGLMTVDDVPGLANAPYYPVMASLTCSVGRFELTGHTSLGESLVVAENRGAVAVWAPSGQSLNEEASILNRAYTAAAYAPSAIRLGDAVLAAIRDYGAQGSQPHLAYVYILLGDPALWLKAAAD
jgi:hypothetical protein